MVNRWIKSATAALVLIATVTGTYNTIHCNHATQHDFIRNICTNVMSILFLCECHRF